MTSNDLIYKSAKLNFKNNQAFLQIGSEFSNVKLVQDKNILSKLELHDDFILLIAALWSSADRMSIKLILQIAELYPNLKFKVKAYDKSDEIKDFLYSGYTTKELFPPQYIFIRNGKIVLQESGKIYNLKSLKERVFDIYK